MERLHCRTRYDKDSDYLFCRATRSLRFFELPDQSIESRLCGYLSGALAIGGLIVAFRLSSGILLWFIAIAHYFVAGIVVKSVAGIPLSMGYGGWKVRRDRHGRIRR